jgi:hypothetical protein
MQFALLHSQRNSPSSLPNSLRSSKIRSFTARMSTEWRDVSCWFKVPLRRRGVFLLQGRKLFPRALDNPLQVRQESASTGFALAWKASIAFSPAAIKIASRAFSWLSFRGSIRARYPPVRQSEPSLAHCKKRGLRPAS